MYNIYKTYCTYTVHFRSLVYFIRMHQENGILYIVRVQYHPYETNVRLWLLMLLYNYIRMTRLLVNTRDCNNNIINVK